MNDLTALRSLSRQGSDATPTQADETARAASIEVREKYCPGCGWTKPAAEFHRNRVKADGLATWCRDCMREAQRLRRSANPEAAREDARIRARRWRAANPERDRENGRRRREADPEAARESVRRWQATRRDAVFDHYGRQCACCGTAWRLTIDHVNGNGQQHRAEIGSGGIALYIWLVKNGFPDGFQVLCRPCNSSKDQGDRCRIAHRVKLPIVRASHRVNGKDGQAIEFPAIAHPPGASRGSQQRYTAQAENPSRAAAAPAASPGASWAPGHRRAVSEPSARGAKRCTKCGTEKPLSDFRLRRTGSNDGRTSQCRSCSNMEDRARRASNLEEARSRVRKFMARQRETDREKVREIWHQHIGKLKAAVLGHYGRACACCGSAERLTVDHVNGDGGAHRSDIGEGFAIYRWLVKNGFPEGFQILCRSCNASKQRGPHCRIKHREAA